MIDAFIFVRLTSSHVGESTSINTRTISLSGFDIFKMMATMIHRKDKQINSTSFLPNLLKG